MNLSRRAFLVVSGLAGGGLAMSLGLPSDGDAAAAPETARLNPFLTIDRTGAITFLLTKHEMGQGVGTGIPMILMEELGGDWNKLKVERADYDKTFSRREMGTTGGSSSIMFMWDIMRHAGATAREMLKQAAAEQWGVGVETLTVANSFVVNPATGDKLEFGKLAQAASRLPQPKDVQLKDPKNYDLIGKPIQNILTKDIVRGASRYGMDMDLPGMMYAAIARCPIYKGKIARYDDAAARQVEGVIDIIRVPAMQGDIQGNHVQEGVAVIASSTWAAFKGKKLLNVTWDAGEFATATLDGMTAAMDEKAKLRPEPTFQYGGLAALSSEGYEVLEANYGNPHQAHALMEPLNSTVHFRGDDCEVWVGNQDGECITKEVAKVVGLPQDKVTTHVLNSGGSFGRRYYADASMEAAYLSKRTGRPVKLTWSREDEIRHDYFHPYQRDYFRAFVNKKTGEVEGVENHIVKTERYAGGTSVWDQLYFFPNIEVRLTTVPPIVHQGAWRSVAEHSSVLGVECFIDELASKVNVDPLEYRLRLLSKQYPAESGLAKLPVGTRDFIRASMKKVFERGPAVLNYIKEKGLWNIDLAPGRGKGLALAKFGSTMLAHIAVVQTSDPDYGYRVERVISVVHCGRVINPRLAQGQIEGGIIWALSAVKYGGLEVQDGRVLRSNYHDNKILRIDETPQIDVHFIDSDDAPSGLGEPAVPPLAPAVLNAIYHACGKRMRKIPVTKTDLEA